MKRDFWNSSTEERKSERKEKPAAAYGNDETLILSLVAMLISDEKNSELIMALLYILS